MNFSPDTRITLLFSGQGAQAVGMGKSLYDSSQAAKKVFQDADDILGRSLSKVAFEGPIEELTFTYNCQPALFVHSLAALAALREKVGDFPILATAGLSLGEFTAHTAAGTFSFETGLRLVEKRGQLMDDACRQTKGTMAALIGAEEEAASALAAEVGVDVANLNCPGQIVLSGEVAKIHSAIELAKGKGIRRATLLNVAGAYHSRLMESAQRALEEELKKTPIQVPHIPVVSNFTGQPVKADDADQIRHTLAQQVTGTVRWTSCIEYVVQTLGGQTFLELGPGEILAGLVRRIYKDAQVASVGDESSLVQVIKDGKFLESSSC